MKPAVILLLTTDSTSEAVACEAVTATRHGLRTLRSAPEAFRALHESCADVDLAIIDLDPGMHGTALLEAAGDRFPVIVLTSLEENYMQPLAVRHGARECLTKPLAAQQLKSAIERVLAMGVAS